MKFEVHTDCPLTVPASRVAPAAPPLIFQEEDGPDADGDQGAPDPNDEADFGFGAAAALAAAGQARPWPSGSWPSGSLDILHQGAWGLSSM